MILTSEKQTNRYKALLLSKPQVSYGNIIVQYINKYFKERIELKKNKLVEDFKKLSLEEFDDLINHFNSQKEEENVEEKTTEEKSDNVKEKEEKTLPDNIATKEDFEKYVTNTNEKLEKYETLLQELMKDKPVGVQRKVINKASNDEDDAKKYYDTSNYLQSLKRK